MPVCEWAVSYEQCSDTAALNSGSIDKSRVEEMATEFLWNVTGRRFGLCDVSVRPCREECGGDLPSVTNGVLRPALIGGEWYNLSCGSCGPAKGCSCRRGMESVALPGPIHSIIEVVVDGVLVPETAYRVEDKRILVRTDGKVWPNCQNLAVPADQPDTWEVRYRRGTAVPTGGMMAAGVLAAEMAKALCNDSGCQLPQRVQSITRQGVTVAVLDTFEGLSDGKTGLWIVDSWVTSVTTTYSPSGVYSPDIPRRKAQPWR